MKKGVRRGRRRQNKGLLILLGGIVAVFVAILIAVGVKFAMSQDLFGGSGTGKEDEKNKVLVTGIEVSCDRPVVRAGEELALDVTVTPAEATDQSLTWTVSGDMGTVSEDGIFLPAAEAGKSDVELTATANDGTEISASITIRVLETIDPEKPMVALTYDDGPHKTNTPALLDVLEENYAVATFFMVGQNIEGKEEIIRRSYKMGNEMASHTWDHENLALASESVIKKQIEDTDAAIKNVVDVDKIILRPPYGAYNDKVKSTAGKPIIIWSVDTMDWSTRSADATYEACMAAEDGDIILMHDIHESTIVAAEDIVKGLQEKGFQLVTVSELYEYRLSELEAGNVHFKMTLFEYHKALEELEAASASEGTEETAETEGGEEVSEDTLEDTTTEE